VWVLLGLVAAARQEAPSSRSGEELLRARRSVALRQDEETLTPDAGAQRLDQSRLPGGGAAARQASAARR
jgi:hypothetical protein